MKFIRGFLHEFVMEFLREHRSLIQEFFLCFLQKSVQFSKRFSKYSLGNWKISQISGNSIVTLSLFVWLLHTSALFVFFRRTSHLIVSVRFKSSLQLTSSSFVSNRLSLSHIVSFCLTSSLFVSHRLAHGLSFRLTSSRVISFCLTSSFYVSQYLTLSSTSSSILLPSSLHRYTVRFTQCHFDKWRLCRNSETRWKDMVSFIKHSRCFEFVTTVQMEVIHFA